MEIPRTIHALRPPLELCVLLGAVVAGRGLVACVDLFHSTGDLRTACEIDASACNGDAGTLAELSEAPTDLGRPDSAMDRAGAALGARPREDGREHGGVGGSPGDDGAGIFSPADCGEPGSDASQPAGGDVPPSRKGVP